MKQKSSDILLILWWIVMFTLTTIPTNKLPGVEIIGLDKLVHTFIYGILTALLWRALAFRKFAGFKILATVLGTILIYAAFDEWHQPFIGRTCSIYDFSADALGVLLVSLILFIRHRKRAARAD